MISYIGILKKLISIDSSYNKSNKEIVYYIASLLKKKKDISLFVQPIKKKRITVYNLIAKIKGENRENPLIFAGHTDTVLAGENWTINPHKPIVRDNRLYGLGASDMKGALALMIHNFLTIKGKPKNDVYLVFTADEENEGAGIRVAEKYLKKEKIEGAKIIVGESTNGKLRLGQKAVLSFRVSISGKSEHAAKVSLSDNIRNNSIQRAIRIIQKLNSFARKININHPLYGKVTFNVGKIIGGEGSNSLPFKTEIYFEFRFPPNKKFSNLVAVKKEIISIIEKTDKKISIENTFFGGFFETAKNNRFVTKIRNICKKEMEENLKIYYDFTWTEASVYKNFGDVVILGPGKIGQPHKKNEHIELTTLKKVNNIYNTIIKNINN